MRISHFTSSSEIKDFDVLEKRTITFRSQRLLLAPKKRLILTCPKMSHSEILSSKTPGCKCYELKVNDMSFLKLFVLEKGKVIKKPITTKTSKVKMALKGFI